MIKPKIRSNICMNAHPQGCAKAVGNQIEYVKKQFAGSKAEGTPKLALIVGCSTGYGLASRIASGFGYGAATVGLSFEKEGSQSKCGTPGFYNNMAYDAEAKKAGLKSLYIQVDAFSCEAKAETIEAVKKISKEAGLPAKIDLFVYSLASPVRTDPKTGVQYRSCIKPIGGVYTGETVDIVSGQIATVSAEAASEEEIANTVKVMGGEDWELWISALEEAGVLADNCRSIAYSYIGPQSSWAIYKNGTIGRAKDDLERAAKDINAKFAKSSPQRHAWVAVCKAVVTRSSAVIPIIPIYISCLFKVMKNLKLHEGCIEQISRLYKERLYTKDALKEASKVMTDSEGRIRIDDLEMRIEVQEAVASQMKKVNQETLFSEADVEGFKHDFLEAHGFDLDGIDYENEDIDYSKI
ncbi:MAG: trans-2-enoyl-CoA reductase family protein [Termitinemataceae bacterium]|nr:MAG: trans-2-enoyl-CoA reductase family protein [Termitinemataceae bacterium]